MSSLHLYGGYAGVDNQGLNSKDEEDVTVRYQTTFIPMGRGRGRGSSGSDSDSDEDAPGARDIVPHVYNYQTKDAKDPKNLLLLFTVQGLSVDANRALPSLSPWSRASVADEEELAVFAHKDKTVGPAQDKNGVRKLRTALYGQTGEREIWGIANWFQIYVQLQLVSSSSFLCLRFIILQYLPRCCNPRPGTHDVRPQRQTQSPLS